MAAKDWNKIIAALALAPVPLVAHAEVYLTEDQAVSVLSPDMKLEPGWVDLTPEESKLIGKGSGERVLNPRVRVWWGRDKRAVIIDRVVGKHEYITYAVAVGPDGKVAGVEIMDYRETFGSEVRGADWRKQFVGKGVQDPVKVGKDIRNISGATLSSVHVANGVRRVLKTYDVLKNKG